VYRRRWHNLAEPELEFNLGERGVNALSDLWLVDSV
jgi:hypothetical protein